MRLEKEIKFCELYSICKGSRYCNGRRVETDKIITNGETSISKIECIIYERFWLGGEQQIL